MPLALLSLGSNLGDRHAVLQAARVELAKSPGVEVKAVSSRHETQPIGGPPGQGPFLNEAVLLNTSLAPWELLELLQGIEARLGRKRTARWGARTLDLDLLLYDDLIMETPQLTLPHPRMAFRRFVLAPAVEVAPEMQHPVIGWSIRRLWEHSITALPYVAIAGMPADGRSHLASRVAERTSARLLQGSRKKIVQEIHVQEIHAGANYSGEFLLLRQSRRLLSVAGWPDPPPLTVTPFWFDQAAAYVPLVLAPDELAAFLSEWRTARQEVVKPKLVIWLDAPTPWLIEHSDHPSDPGFLDRFREALGRQIHQPDVGPWLRLDARDLDAATEEAIAAIQAME